MPAVGRAFEPFAKPIDQRLTEREQCVSLGMLTNSMYKQDADFRSRILARTDLGISRRGSRRSHGAAVSKNAGGAFVYWPPNVRVAIRSSPSLLSPCGQQWCAAYKWSVNRAGLAPAVSVDTVVHLVKEIAR